MTINRAQGCLLGQLAGDALGSLVEFMPPEEIQNKYPEGIRRMADGGTWNTIAGQPTDDSEMALLLARMLIENGTYDPDSARKTYIFWLNSNPFDCGMTIAAGLRGHPNHDSQANGAMMRVSPLGIFGSNYELHQVAHWAKLDASITHPHIVCLQANALYTMAISHAINTGINPQLLYQTILTWANEIKVEPELMASIHYAADTPPTDYVHQQGWVLIAFQNALWQLIHAPNFEAGIIDTVMRGGDTDTNAAICGALLGAVYGSEFIPVQWTDCVLNCRPEAENPVVYRPRPQCFWPVDAIDLASRLINQNQ